MNSFLKENLMKSQQDYENQWTKGKIYKMPNGDIVYHEMNGKGFHRLVVNDKPHTAMSYPAITHAKSEDGATYIAASAFYLGDFPIEQPMLIQTGTIQE